ncbi:hypothetical protein RHSIM_Rhsim10G0111400 [Rhododendron simsii]|uniref:Uncharacterized protein n=1 Tax=Rhododendron simsii TaxID=118357 RepID=A0A834G906_RHOSS|nr:hypothetical protein RHSIM_Rhsim10G0111400 [Rhododendron simsii]
MELKYVQLALATSLLRAKGFEIFTNDIWLEDEDEEIKAVVIKKESIDWIEVFNMGNLVILFEEGKPMGPSMTSDHASSHAPSMTLAPAKSDDPSGAYGYKQDKERRERISIAVGEGTSYQALDEEEEESLLDRRTSGDGTKKKRSKTIGGFFAPRTTPGAQPSIKSALSSKQTIDEARMVIASWWYDANISFNATLSSYYQQAIDAMLAVGPGFKGPHVMT